MSAHPRWYFAVISVSGVFAVTFSVVFAYVADITQEHERSMAYGQVCAPARPPSRLPTPLGFDLARSCRARLCVTGFVLFHMKTSHSESIPLDCVRHF